MISDHHVFVLSKSTFNYNEHRKIPIEKVQALTFSENAEVFELVIHVQEQYDERIDCTTAQNKHNLVGLLQLLRHDVTIFEV